MSNFGQISTEELAEFFKEKNKPFDIHLSNGKAKCGCECEHRSGNGEYSDGTSIRLCGYHKNMDKWNGYGITLEEWYKLKENTKHDNLS